jgi:L-ascorbate metabolism protein UlaG (beta-lactamase superfamily)
MPHRYIVMYELIVTLSPTGQTTYRCNLKNRQRIPGGKPVDQIQVDHVVITLVRAHHSSARSCHKTIFSCCCVIKEYLPSTC